MIHHYQPLLFRGTIAIFIVAMLGCEEYIDPPFELEESRLIISSNFAPDEPVSVRLTNTQPVAGGLRDDGVRDAVVRMYEGDKLIEELSYVQEDNERSGVYRSINFIPRIGIPYTLRASAAGFTPVTASSAIPESVEITSLSVDSLQRVVKEDGLEHFTFKLEVVYDDPDFTDNFYDLRIRQRVYPYHILLSTGDTIFREPIYKAVEERGGELRGNTQSGESSYLIRDYPEEGVSINLTSKVNPQNELPDDLIVELRTVSRDYYNFQTGIQDEQRVYISYSERNVSRNFSNVGGGYGVFAGYSRVMRTFSLGK